MIIGDAITPCNSISYRGSNSISIDKQAVARIAHLARIAVEYGAQERLKGELSGILAWVEQLNALDTSQVAPPTSVTVMPCLCVRMWSMIAVMLTLF